jgi:hypothetical protein
MGIKRARDMGSKKDEVMNETKKTDDCERAGELVAYFYGEANRAERESFDAHLSGCGVCRDELAAFAGVREAVGHWRADILSGAHAFSSAATVAPPDARRERATASAAPPRRAALAAFREFFKLSPVWLRAGVFASALAVCALVALAAINVEVRWDGGGLAFSTRPGSESKNAPAPQAATAGGKVYSQAELEKLVSERDAALRELEDTRAQLDDSRVANLFAAVETLEPASASTAISTHGNTRRERRASPAPAARQKRRPDDRDEDDVPRLYDLLSEAN